VQINLLKGKEGEGVGLKDATVKPGIFKPGEWNHFVVRCQGRKISLKFNGQEAWSAEDENPRAGFVGLQAEGIAYRFRKITLTPLKGDE
jgi:hypothetical protein